MRVKIGDKIYDSNVEPIMIMLSEKEIFSIEDLGEWETKEEVSEEHFEFVSRYCVYPKKWGRFEKETKELIEKFMEIK